MAAVAIVLNSNAGSKITLAGINFTEGQNFPQAPHELSIRVTGDKNIIALYAKNSQVLWKNQKKAYGYPNASYKVEGSLITVYLPILEAGYYKLKVGNIEVPFSVGVQSIKLPKTAVDCLKTVRVDTCVEVYLKEKALRDGSIKPALDELYKLTVDKPETLYTCHNYAHALGQMTAFLYDNYQDAIKQGYDVCHFGFYHGAMESYAALFNTEMLRSKFAVLCDEYSIGFNRGDCTHGLGHIAWWRSGGDFNKAVEICSLASDKVTIGFFRDKDSCVTGVAMEWSNQYLAADNTTKQVMQAGMSDPAFICKTIKDEGMASGCWEFIGPVWGGNDKNIAHMAAICESIKSSLGHEGCWLGIGRDNAFRAEVSTQKAAALCLTATGSPAMWLCMSNVVHSKTVTTRKPGAAKYVCSVIAKSTPNYAAECSGLQTLENERLAAEGRNQLTGDYAQDALSGAQTAPKQG